MARVKLPCMLRNSFVSVSPAQTDAALPWQKRVENPHRFCVCGSTCALENENLH
ncbi:hypothetical protein [Phaeovulum sp.]|uniref:hypothetical protein n=1 Tax=Phaeovulum sp. TaxID=2934796 RepID=UPI00272FF0CF|nr:hypothetical protein [Phaeovulum sp.]MDP1668636.1 hypothetical protein [Phaeovulum sp.]